MSAIKSTNQSNIHSAIQSDFSDDENSNSSIEDVDSKDDLLKQIDRKLVLKFMKEGKQSKTYIIGLENYLKPEDQLTFIKDIQKKLGTSLLKKMTEDNKPIYGLGGDHVNTVYDVVLKKNIAPEKEIKKN
jgi:hypothetical protein